MTSRTTLLILILGVVHSTLCYTSSKSDNLTDIFNEKLTNSSTGDTEDKAGQAVSTEQIFLPSPITVLEIEKKVLGDNFQFTVKYNSTQTPVVEEWMYASGTPGTDVGNGVYETTALASRSGFSDVGGSILTLYTPDYRESILVLSKFGEDVVETNIPELPLYVEPTGDFVYDEGEDFVYKIRVPSYSENVRGSYERFAVSTVLFVDLDTGEAVMDVIDGGYFDTLDSKSYKDYDEMMIKLKTSERRLSGIISMHSVVYDSAFYISRVKDIYVRPSTQTGPFPAGYLGFVKNLKSTDGDNIVCKVGQSCMARCFAVGEKITEIKVERLRADGSIELLSDPVHLVASMKIPYLREYRVIFHVDSMPDQSEKIRCTAKMLPVQRFF